MLRAISTATAGLLAQQARVDAAAHNLANANTEGYKAQGVAFADLLYQQMGKEGIPARREGEATPPAGSGAYVAATPRDFSPGPLVQTGRPLDVAVSGPGMLRVSLPDGRYAYTRCGILAVDARGRLVTRQGYPLDPPVNLPLDFQSLTLNSNGLVTITTSNGQQEAGRIVLYSFANPSGLLALGENLFLPTEASGEAVADENSTLVQGFLEASNVDLAGEMGGLLEAQRAYQLNARVIRAADEMWEMANSLRR
ncbi:flagellar hook-basal body protein [Desulfovirgula thermocuniculi]|uniref:flagellar hook-basal body protein n=1 Tax=Desulfovirgula thermocuniculi TaxID=348842 RepID=UPI00040C3C1F|nr:flagellar hook-basal body complex protein [Desulfovirgula thermocuniculi]